MTPELEQHAAAMRARRRNQRHFYAPNCREPYREVLVWRGERELDQAAAAWLVERGFRCWEEIPAKFRDVGAAG